MDTTLALTNPVEGTDWSQLVPLLWVAGAIAVVVAVFRVITPSWDPDQERWFDRISGGASIIVLIGSGIVLFVASALIVTKTYDFFEQFWPHTAIYPLALLVVWGGAAVTVRVAWSRRDFTPTGIATIVTGGTLALGGVIRSLEELIEAFNHAYAPITFGVVLLVVVVYGIVVCIENKPRG